MKLRTFGEQLESVRKAAHLTQATLGLDVGVDQSVISKLETGRMQMQHSPTNVDLIDRIARRCGVNRGALIGGTPLAAEFPSECMVTLEPDGSVKWLAYFASALTNLDDSGRATILDDAAAARVACEQFRAYMYEPIRYTDPRREGMSSSEVYAIDHAQVSRSHFLVFDARYTSIGAGQELEIAAGSGIPVVILNPKGQKLSRMVWGTYARVYPVEFSSLDELRDGLAAKLTSVVADLTMVRRDPEDVQIDITEIAANDQSETFGQRVRRNMDSMGLDAYTVGRAVGLSEYAVEQLENGRYPNPTLTIMRRLARVFRTSVSEMVDGVPRRLEDYDDVLRGSWQSLSQFAVEDNLSHADFLQLQANHYEAYKTQRLEVADARTVSKTVREWRDEYNAKKRGETPGVRQRALLKV